MKEIQQFNNEGMVFGSINKDNIERFEIRIPPIEIIEKYQRAVKPLDDKVIWNTIQIHTLEKLRNTLFKIDERGDKSRILGKSQE